MSGATGENGITLRWADASDADLVFAWRNDPWIVSLSAGRKTVTAEEHARWFAATLASPDAALFIIVGNGEDAGTLRLDRAGEDRCFLTVYLMKPFVGRGWGSAAIAEGARRAFEIWPELQSVRASIRQNNAPSIAAFGKAGFVHCEPAAGELSEAASDDEERLIEMMLPRLNVDG